MTYQEIEKIINEYAGGLTSVLFSYNEVLEICLKVLEDVENERERQLPN